MSPTGPRSVWSSWSWWITWLSLYMMTLLSIHVLQEGESFTFECKNQLFQQTLGWLIHCTRMSDWSFLSFDCCVAASVPLFARKMRSGRCVLLAWGPAILHLKATEEAGKKTRSRSNLRIQEARKVNSIHNAPHFYDNDNLQSCYCKITFGGHKWGGSGVSSPILGPGTELSLLCIIVWLQWYSRALSPERAW